MKYAIITGGSKGIGNGLAMKFKQEGYKIISIARSTNPNLSSEKQYQCDLTDLKATEDLFKSLMEQLIAKNPSEVVLINNAGMIGTIDRLENNTPKSIAKTIELNVSIPLGLSALFIQAFKDISIKKDIINISSGAAVSPYYGWSSYCASKAAMDMFTKVTALEQNSAKNPVRVLAIYPGIVDTNMQVQIRKRTKEQFASVDKFVESKVNNLLASPEESAQAVYALFTDNSIKGGSIKDVR